ncbi:MAG TPA: ABC transporter substrate-binding protein, partial [Nitrospirota bacterium]|nr:ABC transporter substrate-binding protein [Nitrospirota bacterium]
LLQAQGDADGRLGAEIEWKLMGTGPEIMKAFGKGELDLAYVGLPPAIIGIDQGTKVICVAGGHEEGTVMAGKQNWTGYPETADLGNVLKQFRGRRIGVPGKGSIHDVILKDCIEHYGLEREIEIRNYAWADMVTEAVVNDEVAAAFGTPALAIAIKRFAGGRVLYPPSRLWPENPSYGILAEKDFLTDQQELVKRFLVLHEEAEVSLRDDPEGAAQAIAGYVGIIDREFVLETLRVSPRYCAKLTPGYISSTLRFVTALKRLGYIRREISREEIFDTSLIDAVHPAKDHYGDAFRRQ